ncbi:MAG: type ISP restriction/modification enzyme, partial [Abditibacteriaceae bacterium]
GDGKFVVAAPRGEIAAGFPKYENGKITINKSGEGFADVPESVWNFHIGGYQVAHKWLKDRKGRTLSDADAAHYTKVLLALAATIEEMAAIDEIINTHGGAPQSDSSQSAWPLPGSQDKSTFGEDEVKKYFAR